MTDALLSETSEEMKWPAEAWRVSLKQNTESSHNTTAGLRDQPETKVTGFMSLSMSV